MDRLDSAILRASRNHDSFALAYLDMDGFKQVNDTYGHLVDDQLLIQIASRLKDRLRGADTVARLGGDEFGLVLDELSDGDVALRVAQALVDSLQAPFALHGNDGDIDVEISASIGLAMYPDNATEPDALIHAADEAMYQIKRAGRNGCCLAQASPQT